MKGLTSRERVIRALNHQETDRVPIDIGSLVSLSSLHKDAYSKLLRHLGQSTDNIQIAALFSQAVLLDEAVRQRFKVDCYPLALKGASNWKLEVHTEVNGDRWFVDEWGIKWKMPRGGFYYDAVEHPLSDCTLDDIEKYPWPNPRDPGRIEGPREQAELLYNSTDYALVMNGAMLTGGTYAPCQLLMGFENFFVKLMTEPEVIEAMIGKMLEYQLGQWDVILDAVGKYAQVVVMSDDLGTQKGPVMNPEIYRELIKPAHTKTVNFIKSKADVKVLLHCCGAVRDFLPDFADVGFDAWNPVQVTAAGLDDTAKLKRDYGDKITFWGGGCDSQHILSLGSPADIRAEVKRRVYDLAPGGGLVLTSVMGIQPDVPLENIVALYDAFCEFSTEFYTKNR